MTAGGLIAFTMYSGMDGSESTLVERLWTVVETIQDGLYHLDAEGRIVAVNEVLVETTGYSREQLVGSDASLVVPGEDIERVESRIQNLLSEGKESDTIEVDLKTASGNRIPHELRIGVLIDSDEFRGTVGVARDISIRREYERRLERRTHQAETELDALLGRASDAFFALDEDFRFVYLNEGAEELLQRSSDQLQEEVFWELFPEAADNHKIWNAFTESMEDRESRSLELFFEPFGFWLDATVYPSEIGISVYFRDISKQKEREHELTRYETIIETIEDGIYVVNEDGRFEMVNDAYENLTGYSEDELIGSPASLVVDDEVAEQAQEIEQQMLEEGEEAPLIEAEIQTADGQAVPAEATFALMPGETGERIGVARDISERKEREQELDRLRELREHAERVADVGAWEIDPDTEEVFWSEHLFEILGFSGPDEPPLSEALDVYHEEDRPEVAEMIQQALDQGEPLDFESRFYRGDDEIGWLHVWGLPHIEDGEVLSLRGAAQDITDRKSREKELQKREQQYRALADHFPDGAVALFNGDHEYLAAGGELLDELDVPAEEVVGDTIQERYPPKLRAQLEPRFAAALEGEHTVFELSVYGRHLQAQTLPVPGPAGEIERGMVIVQDITQRVEHERFLEDAKAQLEAATEAGAVGTWEWDVREDSFVCGESFANMFGVDPEMAREGVSVDVVTDAIHESDRDRVIGEIEEVLETCGEYKAEYRVWNADDELRWVVARGQVECDDAGHAVSFPGALTDITERKENELELEAHNRLQEAFRSICAAAAEADAREEIENEICEGLVEIESYAAAGIVRIEDDENETHLTAFRWTPEDDKNCRSGYLEETVSPLITRALESGEVQVGTASGFPENGVNEQVNPSEMVSSIAAVPIIHEEIPYGVVTIYARSPDAFSEPDTKIIAELGRIIGVAIAGLERKQALVSDEGVEGELRVDGVAETFGIPGESDEPFEIDRIVSTGEGGRFLAYASGSTATVKALSEGVDDLEGIERVDLLGDESAIGETCRCELQLENPPLIEPIVANDAQIRRITFRNNSCRVVLLASASVTIQRITESLQNEFEFAIPLAIRNVNRNESTSRHSSSTVTAELTDRQRGVLEAAYERGYFDWPRETTGVEVAESLDISPSTLSEHMRTSERKLLEAIFEKGA